MAAREILLDNTNPERVASFPKVVDDAIVKEVIKAMKAVTKPGGACASADIWGYTEAGKTGTTMKLVGGQYSEKSHFSSFSGFTPVTKPAFVVVVGMDEPLVGYVPGRGLNHMGSSCAAPVFREIARRSLEYLGVPPDDPGGYPKRDPRHDPATADWYKETEELKKLYEQWNGKRQQ